MSFDRKSGLDQRPAVSLRDVSKKYQLYESMRHRVYEALHPFNRPYHREFWALRGVTLTIPRGATLGILGVNGSGKSTLLQIICSILQPTTGEVEISGKVAALIELGAGFNPDLTGRENAEINCAIQGLSGRAVRARLPEIEAFADIGEFFDQPVKTYSSGMFMRVAFATAVSVDPDILIIDEALAVGDAKFQQKCFQKFRDFQKAGKTILFVTHDRFAVPRLCDIGLLLDKGQVVEIGDPHRIVNLYAEILAFGRITLETEKRRDLEAPLESLEAGMSTGESSDASQRLSAGETEPAGDYSQIVTQAFLADSADDDRAHLNPSYNKNEHRYGDRRAIVIDYLAIGAGNVNPECIPCGSDLEIYMKVHFRESLLGLVYGFTINATDGLVLFGTNTELSNTQASPGSPGEIRIYKMSTRLNLAPGDIFITIGVGEGPGKLCDIRQSCIHLQLADTTKYVGVAKLEASLQEIQAPRIIS